LTELDNISKEKKLQPVKIANFILKIIKSSIKENLGASRRSSKKIHNITAFGITKYTTLFLFKKRRNYKTHLGVVLRRTRPQETYF